jgi:hypothetical protein
LNEMRGIWLLPFLIVAMTGCDRTPPGSSGVSSDRIPPHTHLWLDGGSTHVWTYQMVAERTGVDGNSEPVGRHCKSLLKQGEAYKLNDGTWITFNKTGLKIGDLAIPTDTLDLVVGDDGRVELGAFIRTFK